MKLIWLVQNITRAHFHAISRFYVFELTEIAIIYNSINYLPTAIYAGNKSRPLLKNIRNVEVTRQSYPSTRCPDHERGENPFKQLGPCMPLYKNITGEKKRSDE